MSVTEYSSVEGMTQFASCNALGVVTAEYGVFMHSPPGRKRAASIKLREAALSKGGNTVVMTVNDWGLTTDQVTGMAYHCTPKDSKAVSRVTSDDDSTALRLRELDVLRDEELISDDEYNQKRAKILDGL